MHKAANQSYQQTFFSFHFSNLFSQKMRTIQIQKFCSEKLQSRVTLNTGIFLFGLIDNSLTISFQFRTSGQVSLVRWDLLKIKQANLGQQDNGLSTVSLFQICVFSSSIRIGFLLL